MLAAGGVAGGLAGGLACANALETMSALTADDITRVFNMGGLQESLSRRKGIPGLIEQLASHASVPRLGTRL